MVKSPASRVTVVAITAFTKSRFSNLHFERNSIISFNRLKLRTNFRDRADDKRIRLPKNSYAMKSFWPRFGAFQSH